MDRKHGTRVSQMQLEIFYVQNAHWNLLLYKRLNKVKVLRTNLNTSHFGLASKTILRYQIPITAKFDAASIIHDNLKQNERILRTLRVSQGPGAFNSGTSNFYANDGPYGHFIFGRWNIFISKAISKNLQTGNSSRWSGESIGKSEKFSTKNSKRKFWFRKRNFSRCFWRNFRSLSSQTKDSGIQGLKTQCNSIVQSVK